MLPLLTDTHCHIHDTELFAEDGDGAYRRAQEVGVHRIVCVGTDVKSSLEAVRFAEGHERAWAVVGIHPHDASVGVSEVAAIRELAEHQKVVGIGEIGLDFYYTNSPKSAQLDMLHAQLTLASELGLPVNFHVREGFSEFWPIFDQYTGLRGVLHSFTDDLSNMAQGLSRGLLIGINGISTFAKERDEVNSVVPLESIVLETDAPFLTPTPNRGTVNEPAFITLVARYIADLRSISLQELSSATERNATELYF